MDIKTLIFIISTACIGAGFYYTTEARLESVEREILFLERQVHAIKADNKRLNRLITKIRKGTSKNK
jgi:hypothetical protein